MKSMKLMLPALLLSLSLGVYAQDDDELLEATSEEEATEVSVPTHPWEKPIFHRVLLGFRGTSAKYSTITTSPGEGILGDESYFLSGISLGWMSDIVLTKNRNLPLYIEVGALFNYQTGHYDGYDGTGPTVKYKWHSRVYSFSMTIPINISYQFKDFRGVKGLTLAPYAGVYGRFNFVADRRLKKTSEYYKHGLSGEEIYEGSDFSCETKSLMKSELNNGWTPKKTHTGKLLQLGAQVGVNAFYKRYSFGIQYMYEFLPFARHSSPNEISSSPNDVGGKTIKVGTGCDMEISTAHNFAITVGYIF